MSSKLNITEIIQGHFATFTTAEGTLSRSDICAFVGLPLVISVVLWVAGYDLTVELRSLLVNFGAIFTALLLSVLVLVYDQERKCEETQRRDVLVSQRKVLLHQLYYNISFSIICAIALVIASLVHAVAGGYVIEVSMGPFHLNKSLGFLVFTPLIAFITSTVFLNVIMIVKRMHALLTT